MAPRPEHLSPEAMHTLLMSAVQQGVGSLLYYYLKKKGLLQQLVSETDCALLADQYYFHAARSVLLHSELERVLTLLNSEGISSILLKGASLSEKYYPSPEIRPYHDIDILFHREDITRVRELLLDSGYTRENESAENFRRKYRYSLHFFNPRQRIELETHWNIAQPSRYAINIEELWEQCVPIKIGDALSSMVSGEDLIISQSLHFSIHYFYPLLLLIDIALIMEKERDHVSWDNIVRKCKDQRVCAPVYYTLLYANKLLNIDVPKNALKELRPKRLADVIIKSMVNTEDIPNRTVLDNIFFRNTVSLLLMDRMKERMSFGLEYIARIPPMIKLYAQN